MVVITLRQSTMAREEPHGTLGSQEIFQHATEKMTPEGIELPTNKIDIPSGELTFCHGKWQFIVDFPIKNGDFPLLC